MLGVIKEINNHIRNYEYDKVCGAASGNYPRSYTIPKENTGTLKNQGAVGCCVAEVIASISEELWKRQLGVQEEHSEGFVYSEFRSEYFKQAGLIVTQALEAWCKIGTVPKKFFDIVEEMPAIKQLVMKFPELLNKASKFKISGFVDLSHDKNRDINIKDALTRNKYGLLAVANTYFDESHCIQLVGWNDETNSYVIKNSWGSQYGDNGYAEIPKSEINNVYLPLLEEIVLPFSDVAKDAWYYKDVKNMYFNGLMNGTSATTFEPDKPITRAEAAAMFNRILKNIDERFDNLNKVLSTKIEQ